MNGLGRKKENEENKNQSVFTRETFGVILVLFAVLCAICLITRDMVFSVPGKFVNAFLFGCFGYFAYAVMIYAIIAGVRLIVGKKSTLSGKRKALLTLAFFCATLIIHVITMHGSGLSFGEYLAKSYTMADGGFTTASGGGIVMALIAYPVTLLLTEVGTYVVVGIIFAVSVYFSIKYAMADAQGTPASSDSKFRSSFVKEEKVSPQIPSGVEVEGEREYPVQAVQEVNNLTVDLNKPSKQKLFVSNPEDFHLKTKRDLTKGENDEQIQLGFADGGLGVVSVAQDQPVVGKDLDYQSKLDYIKTPPDIDMNALRTASRSGGTKKPEYSVPQQPSQTTVSKYINPRAVDEEKKEEIPFIEHTAEEVVDDSAIARAEAFNKYAEVEDVKPSGTLTNDDVVFRAVKEGRIEEIIETPKEEREQSNVDDIPLIEEEFSANDAVEEKPAEKVPDEVIPPTNIREGRARSILFDDEKVDDAVGLNTASEGVKKEEKIEDAPVNNTRTPLGFTSRVEADGNLGERISRAFEEEKPKAEEKPPKVIPPVNREYFRPPFDLLEYYAPPVDAYQENHEERKEIIQRTLEEFHINAIPQGHVQGPSITRYEIMMPAGVSVKKVLAFDDDLKMRLESKEGVRIEAPIPGKNLVGIEVANEHKTTVGLREIMENNSGKKSSPHALMFALGKDLVGNAVFDDLTQGPHYLVAGATGSGKSVCLNLMIVSLIMRYSPEDLRLILVDPKGVEFTNYEHLPHLMLDEIITEPKKSLAVLSWAYAEMQRRFALCREKGGGLVRGIEDYNTIVASDTVPKMPRLVIIIDEVADLMETCKKDLESRIRALAQKARAVGIHLILATQRPSVDIITGTIKANLPARIAFKVMNFNDSQTIMNEAGAEKLLGMGDMLYKAGKMSSTARYQGAYISSREVKNIVDYIIEHNTAYFDDELAEYLEKESKPKQEVSATDSDGGRDENEVNEFFLKALWLAVTTESVSISQLQRRFQIGYQRAGGLVDKMERMGFVSPNEGSKARRVLLSKEEFIERFGEINDER